jgi:hypothetical protein
MTQPLDTSMNNVNSEGRLVMELTASLDILEAPLRLSKTNLYSHKVSAGGTKLEFNDRAKDALAKQLTMET